MDGPAPKAKDICIDDAVLKPVWRQAIVIKVGPYGFIHIRFLP